MNELSRELRLKFTSSSKKEKVLGRKEGKKKEMRKTLQELMHWLRIEVDA